MSVVARTVAALGAVALLITGCGASDSSAPADGRPVAHAMGVSTVSAQPSRVVVLDTQELDAAVSLGVTPVGSTRASVSEELPSFLQGKVVPGAIKTVGTIQDPDLEAIATLQPDLILSSKLRHERIYPQLQAIAPTVLSERTGDAWKDNLRLYADALGRAPQAQRLLTAYQTRTSELGRRVNAAQTTVSVIRQTPEDLRLYGPRSFVGSVLTDTGFARPEIVRSAPKAFVEIGPEQIGQADADVVYATTYGNVPKLSASPLWRSLSAVRAGRAFEVPDDSWMLAIGPTGANLVLDDLERTLTAP
ncbi:ABC transporter substrate-binding protein [Pseudonocardia sp. KRD291]|uniref:ABC transporter substrate-binding protein n=1 Tax=Pseudonocardia sp. KRD291 TaxID=2792007 RepID=UPI001C4A64CF|nr:iron-siderophore ABC transporter substrate-binding protein [Pseudonocardia sp. KRD291]MBW0101188.1 iron-siderophore ABC transporter substrate-binding protein [Pseudonocardia sp. KRD291]